MPQPAAARGSRSAPGAGRPPPTRPTRRVAGTASAAATAISPAGIASTAAARQRAGQAPGRSRTAPTAARRKTGPSSSQNDTSSFDSPECTYSATNHHRAYLSPSPSGSAASRQTGHRVLIDPGLEPVLVLPDQDREQHEARARTSGLQARPPPPTPTTAARSAANDAHGRGAGRLRAGRDERAPAGTRPSPDPERPGEPEHHGRRQPGDPPQRGPAGRVRRGAAVASPQRSWASEYVPLLSRLSFPCVTSSSQIPGGNPVGGVIPEIADCLLPPRLRPDSSSSLASLNRFLNALYAPSVPLPWPRLRPPSSVPSGRLHPSGERSPSRAPSTQADGSALPLATPVRGTPRSTSRNAALSSTCGRCPTPGITANRAPGISPASSRATSGGLTMSSSPTSDERRHPDRPEPVAGVVLDRRAGLPGEGLGVLRPLVPLGEPDQALDQRRVPVKPGGDQPGQCRPGEPGRVGQPLEHAPTIRGPPSSRRSPRRGSRPGSGSSPAPGAGSPVPAPPARRAIARRRAPAAGRAPRTSRRRRRPCRPSSNRPRRGRSCPTSLLSRASARNRLPNALTGTANAL